MKLEKIILCVDMAGCPNRCKHCWVGVTKNRHLDQRMLREIAEGFRSYTHKLEIISWYREPDYRDDYKELWKIETELSDEHTPHFELASFWRLVRDEDYATWLYNLGVRQCQLTLFGQEETTDRYIGRSGAYKEILKAIDILLEHKIAPRIQVFVNQENINEMQSIVNLIERLNLEERCRVIGQEFHYFVHQGSCEGGNAALYNIRVTQQEINQLPRALVKATLEYMNKECLDEVFGISEGALVKSLIDSEPRGSIVNSSPVLYIDHELNVYPNETTPKVQWCLGNIEIDGVDTIIYNYLSGRSSAQQVMEQIPIGEIIKLCGNADSQKLFMQSDYIGYIVNQYMELMNKEQLGK